MVFGEFCTDCGAVLDLSKMNPTTNCVACYCCQAEIDVNKFIGGVSSTRIVFNNKSDAKRAYLLAKRNKKQLKPESAGPVVDMECKSCGNGQMTYATLQTRSADEGQTVFYTCTKCGFQFNENS